MFKSVLRNYFGEARTRWRILTDREPNRERRIFAALELFCFPMSAATVFVLLPAQVIALRAGVEVPGWCRQLLTVLLSAAVGYLTNYIALEMLFKPYRRSPRHPLSLLTLGYWKQGLVPKNKNKIGSELGRQIETRLLDPEKLADDLCALASDAMQSPELIGKIRDSAQTMLREHEQKIVAFLIPQIEHTLADAVARIVTRENLLMFWDREVAPKLRSEHTRELIAGNIVEGLRRRSPELVAILKSELRSISYEFLSRRLPFGAGADTLSEGLVRFVDWRNIETRLRDKLGEDSTGRMIRDELQEQIEKFELSLKSPDSEARIDRLLTEARRKLNVFLASYLHETLPALAGEVIESESLWNWVEAELLPNIKPRLQSFLREHGRDQVVARLRLAERVSEAVEKQDVEEFHKMINSIAAEHLGAIQVLGYLLGAIVGLAQLAL